MIIKKFQANTETEAVMLAKEDLGKDAIVMNIKTIKPKGIFSVFRKTCVEVTAAVDEMNEKNADKTTEGNTSSKFNAQIDERLHPERKERESQETKKLEERLNRLAMLVEQQITMHKNAEREEDSVIEQTNADSTEVTEKQEAAAERQALTSEKDHLKSKLVDLIMEQLAGNDVSYAYAKQIIDEITHVGNVRTMDDMLACVYQKIILKLGEAKTITLYKGEKAPKVIFFVGPTGVGKTTTIAKLSSKLILEEKKKIAIFTADTYRIAAVEQIKTYANILSIPVEVIYEPTDLKAILPKYKEYDYIVIDTAGRSHKNREQVDDLKALFNAVSGRNIFTYLVLSATTKYKDLKKIASLYEDISNYGLIFTKLDETDAIGNILNIKLDTGMPLSYVSYGQNVPDDIEVFNPQIIAKQVLGGTDGYGSGR